MWGTFGGRRKAVRDRLALQARGEAKDSALLSGRDAGLLEPPERSALELSSGEAQSVRRFLNTNVEYIIVPN